MEGRNPDPAILQMLLDAGADPNVPAYGDSDTWAGWTPLLVMADKLPLVQMFLDAGADLTEVTAWLQREQMFLDAGADPFVRSPEGAAVLHVALWTRTSPAPVVRFFLDLGVPPDLPNKYSYTPLLAACFTEHLDLTTFRYLLDAGANPNVRDERGRTPLDIVTGRGDEAIAQLLRNATGAQNDSPATPPEEGEGVTRLTCATCCQEAYRDEANCQSMLPFCNCAPSEPPDDSEDDGFMDPLCCTDWGREQDFAFCEDVSSVPRAKIRQTPPSLPTWAPGPQLRRIAHRVMGRGQYTSAGTGRCPAGFAMIRPCELGVTPTATRCATRSRVRFPLLGMWRALFTLRSATRVRSAEACMSRGLDQGRGAIPPTAWVFGGRLSNETRRRPESRRRITGALAGNTSGRRGCW